MMISYIIIDEIPRITCTKERDVIIIIRGIIVYRSLCNMNVIDGETMYPIVSH